VDVQRRWGCVEELVGEHAHVPVQTDEIEVVIGESVEDPSLVGLARLPVFALDDLGRDPAFRGGLQHGRLFAVGQDDRQLRITRRGVGDVSEVPSPVARESGDLHTRWVRPIAYIDCGPVRVCIHVRGYMSPENRMEGGNGSTSVRLSSTRFCSLRRQSRT